MNSLGCTDQGNDARYQNPVPRGVSWLADLGRLLGLVAGGFLLVRFTVALLQLG